MDRAAEIGSMHWALVDIRSLVWFITIRSGRYVDEAVEEAGSAEEAVQHDPRS
jgi:hypothetical protein